MLLTRLVLRSLGIGLTTLGLMLLGGDIITSVEYGGDFHFRSGLDLLMVFFPSSSAESWSNSLAQAIALLPASLVTLFVGIGTAIATSFGRQEEFYE